MSYPIDAFFVIAESLGITKDFKTVYTNALLSEMAAKKNCTHCSFSGCRKMLYKGRVQNPFFCCAQHRSAIQASLSHQHKIYIQKLMEYGLWEQIELLKKAGWNHRRLPAEYVRIRCVQCKKYFEVLKSRQIEYEKRGIQKVSCPQCNNTELENLTCARCKGEFKRLRSRVRDAQKHGQINTYCSTCSHREKQITQLTCQWCQRPFLRTKFELEKGTKRGYHNVYCSHGCAKEARQKPINLICARCKIEFQRPAWMVNKAKKLKCKRAFCPQCTSAESYRIQLHCSNCGKIFIRSRYLFEGKGYEHVFCSRYCRGKFKNTQKEES